MRRLPLPFIFALIFCALFLAHAPLLRLPYYWDEAGYYIPAAHDLLTTGSLVPRSIPSNAHPPLVMAYLALWWKLSGFTPAVTRTAMLLLAALGLTAVFRISSFVLNAEVAIAATLCTAIYPVFFAQSSMAHVDLAAAALALWGIAFLIEGRRAAATVAFSLAVLAKETVVIVPFSLAMWELAWKMVPRESPVAPPRRSTSLALLFIPAAVLAAWFAYHYHRTGFVFGNPDYFRYNVSGTLHPVRMLFASFRRLWQVTGYMNLFVLSVAAALAMMFPPRPEDAETSPISHSSLPEPQASSPRPGGSEEAGTRPRIALHIQGIFMVVILAHVFALSLIGGAVLARYMLIAIPLAIILFVSTLRRRVRAWPLVIAATCAAFVLALFTNPPYRFAMEDNLAYRDYILLHRGAADYLAAHDSRARVLTAWPATDELAKPYLGYLRAAIPVVPIETFSVREIARAAHDTSRFDVVYVFSTKYEPPTQPALLRWWERTQEGYFDYHRDLPPELIARALGGRIVWRQARKGQWAAIIVVERAENAHLRPESTGTILSSHGAELTKASVNSVPQCLRGESSLIGGLLVAPAAAAAPAAISAPASAEAATASAAAAGPLYARTRFIHRDRPSAELRSVQRLDRVLGLGIRRHLYEPEASRLAGVPVADQRDFVDCPVCLECRAQLLLGHPVVEVANVDILHGVPSEVRLSMRFFRRGRQDEIDSRVSSQVRKRSAKAG